MAKALARIGEAAAAGANIVCLQELLAGLYPCQSEDHRRFDEAESIPGPTCDALAAAARQHGVVLVASLFEQRAAGLLSQHGRGVRGRRLPWPARIGRCTFRTIRSTTKSFISHRAILAFENVPPQFGARAVGPLVCRSVVSRNGRLPPALAGSADAVSIRLPSAGCTRRRGQEYGCDVAARRAGRR